MSLLSLTSVSSTLSKTILLILLFCALIRTSSADTTPTASTTQTPTAIPTVDPFKDPEHDIRNPLRYIPNNVLTTIALVLLLIVAILQTILIIKKGAKWMMAMTIGAYCFALGIAFRYGLHSDPHSLKLIVLQSMFVTLSPCAFIAANYVLLGRLAKYLNVDNYLIVSSRRLTLVFILSDVFTFLIQGSGGGLTSSSTDQKTIDLGTKLFMIGLILQMVSFALFSMIYGIFLYRIYTKDKPLWRLDNHRPWYNRWNALAAAMVISCIGILVRSGYRVAEIEGGFGSALARNEGTFYGLDTLPLFIAISIYVPFWPGRFIKDEQPAVGLSSMRHGLPQYARVERGGLIRGSNDSTNRTVVELGHLEMK